MKELKKQFISISLIIGILLSFSVKAFAIDSLSDYLKQISEPNSNATVITTASELANIKEGVYIIGSDIDLSQFNNGEWIPITPTGDISLDGQGHIISNLTCTNTTYGGLFGEVRNCSISIKNLGLTDVHISSQVGGGLIAEFYNSGVDGMRENHEQIVIENSFVEGCCEDGTINGLLIGDLKNYTSFNRFGNPDCEAFTSVIISDTYVNGTIEGDTSGGFIGNCEARSGSNSDNYGELALQINNSNSYTKIFANVAAGGFVGKLYYYNTDRSLRCNNCTVDSEISSDIVGGIVGYAFSFPVYLGNCSVKGEFKAGQGGLAAAFLGSGKSITFESNCYYSCNLPIANANINNPELAIYLSEQVPPAQYMGDVRFLSNWDSNARQAYFDYSALAYSVTDNTEISPNQSIDQLVGKYVLVKVNESSSLEISSIELVDSKIGTVTDVIVGNDNPAVTSLQFEDGTYSVVNGLLVSEGIIGKQVLYHLSSKEIVGYTELQEKTGTLEEWDSHSGQLVIDGVTYFTNYIADENLFTIADQLVGKRVEVLCLEGTTASYIFQITEAKEDYHIRIYASTPNLSTNIDGTIDIVCSLYRDDKLVEDWVEPAFVIGNDKVISTSDYILKDGSYSFTITGLSEGRSSLTVSDSYSGAHITVDISVGKATSRAYSYRMDDIPSFVPNVYGESELTNFYNINDLYVNNFSYTGTNDGGYDVSFNVYNQGYMYGSVDVYDKDGKWIQSEKIDKFSDISSLWDTGEAVVYLIADSFDGKLLSYTSGVLSKETPVSVYVPEDGYLTISNNFAESPGVFLYNTVDYLMLSVNTIVDASVNGVQTSQIADDIVDKAIKDIDFQQEFMDKFNEIALNVSQTSLEFGFGEAAKAVTVDAEDLLDSIGLNWKASAESVVGELESVFVELAGPVGIVLDKCFAFTKLTSYVVQTSDICYSTNAPSILIHVPASASNTTTVQGVTVTTGNDVIDSEAVLQVFRISDTDAIEIIGEKIPVEDYRLYNICFVKNEKEVQPNGKVTVKIPIPKEYDKNRCVIYRQESDGSWAILQAVVEGNYLVFETNHFSLYAIADASTVSSISVTSVELNTSGVKLNQVGDVYQLKANVLPINAINKSVTWISSNPSVATVDNAGLVTALANGTTTITAKTVDGGYTASCTVTVNIETTSNNAGNSSGSNNSGGGSVTPTSYTISISDTDGGTITISPKTASKDKTVTITAVPDEGYKLNTLFVSDKNGNQIELTKKTDTEYTFKMPASKLTVNATFSKIIVDPEPSSIPFTDVSENAWYYNAVRYVYENGMMQGISDTEFAPTLSMNRAMIVTVLHRLENTPVTTNTNQFTDVQSNQWYTEAIQWAAEQGIISGYGNGQFGTTDNVTREQLAVILYNYTKHIDGDVSVAGDMTIFTDANNTSNWAEDAISWAVGVGLMSGKGNNILDPIGIATRAEVAQMLMNYCTKIA